MQHCNNATLLRASMKVFAKRHECWGQPIFCTMVQYSIPVEVNPYSVLWYSICIAFLLYTRTYMQIAALLKLSKSTAATVCEFVSIIQLWTWNLLQFCKAVAVIFCNAFINCGDSNTHVAVMEGCRSYFLTIVVMLWMLQLFYDCWSYFMNVAAILWLLQLFYECFSYFMTVAVILWLLTVAVSIWLLQLGKYERLLLF